MATRNIQVPGAPNPTPTDDQQGAAPDDGGQDTQDTTLTAPVPEAPAKPATKRAGKPTTEDYAKMRAADVDPTTLTAPVLTLDGYLVPAPKDAK